MCINCNTKQFLHRQVHSSAHVGKRGANCELVQCCSTSYKNNASAIHASQIISMSRFCKSKKVQFFNLKFACKKDNPTEEFVSSISDRHHPPNVQYNLTQIIKNVYDGTIRLCCLVMVTLQWWSLLQSVTKVTKQFTNSLHKNNQAF